MPLPPPTRTSAWRCNLYSVIRGRLVCRGPENNVVSKKRSPFFGGGEIISGSSNQFVSALPRLNQTGASKAGYNFCRVNDVFSDAIYFHARETNGRGWTLAVHVNNFFKIVFSSGSRAGVTSGRPDETRQSHTAHRRRQLFCKL